MSDNHQSWFSRLRDWLRANGAEIPPDQKFSTSWQKYAFRLYKYALLFSTLQPI